MSHRAVLLDRDGTLVHPRHYPSRPEHLVLFGGVGEELRELQQTGWRIVVVTNQAGIARGLFTEADLLLMHRHLRESLAHFSVHIDGIYHCPHHIDGVIPELTRRCDCRKPQPGMLLQAARDLDLDLEASWFVGDILDDVEAGNRAGCRTILNDLGTESLPSSKVRTPTYVARNTVHALRMIRAVEHGEHGVDLGYRPATWGSIVQPETVHG